MSGDDAKSVSWTLPNLSRSTFRWVLLSTLFALLADTKTKTFRELAAKIISTLLSIFLSVHPSVVVFWTDLEPFAARLPQPRNLFASDTRLLAALLWEIPQGGAEAIEVENVNTLLGWCTRLRKVSVGVFESHQLHQQYLHCWTIVCLNHQYSKWISINEESKPNQTRVIAVTLVRTSVKCSFSISFSHFAHLSTVTFSTALVANKPWRAALVITQATFSCFRLVSLTPWRYCGSSFNSRHLRFAMRCTKTNWLPVHPHQPVGSQKFQNRHVQDLTLFNKAYSLM